jgi:hypothetical protein
LAFGSDDKPGIAGIHVELGHVGAGTQVGWDSVPEIQRSTAGLNSCFAVFFRAFAAGGYSGPSLRSG